MMKKFRLNKIHAIRQKLKTGEISIGSWMQIPHSSVAEIFGHSGYDWVTVDMEHGSISTHQLPDLFRALELGGVLPMTRLAEGNSKDCKRALDAGSGGVIVPMIDSADKLISIRDACRWPPAGRRGVGYSRANMFGKYFNIYAKEAQSPLLVAQIENINAVDNLKEILSVKGLDAILIGPYDLSASMNITGQFDHSSFKEVMKRVLHICRDHKIPPGIHVVQPDKEELRLRIDEGYKFIAYSLDTVFLSHGAQLPKINY